MPRITAVAVCIMGLLCVLTTQTVSADRLILIPTGRTLPTGAIKAEYAAKSPERVYWVHVGLPLVEVEGARFENFGGETVNAISAQLGILPQTAFTPGIAVGIRDITNETGGTPYEGRAIYAAATMGIPVTEGVPLLLSNVRFHGGLGTDSLSGVFFGVEGTIVPMGLRVAAEYDSSDFNVAASYSIVPMLRARVSSIKGDVFYGAEFSLAL